MQRLGLGGTFLSDSVVGGARVWAKRVRHTSVNLKAIILKGLIEPCTCDENFCQWSINVLFVVYLRHVPTAIGMYSIASR
jgi:hypothetical protein